MARPFRSEVIMNYRGLAILPFVLCLLISPSSVLAASEYRCKNKPVDNDAIAVSYTDVDVNAHSNPTEKVCTFTIDGPKRDSNGTRGSIVSGASVFSKKDIDIENIARRLTLSRSIVDTEVDGFRKRIVDALMTSKNELVNCFLGLRDFDNNRTPPAMEETVDGFPIYLKLERRDLVMSCIVYPRGRHTTFASAEATLQLLAEDRGKGTHDILYVPIGAIR